MFFFIKIKKALLNALIDLSWTGIFAIILSYVLINWILLSLSGEKIVYSFSDFIYWLVVTASTVGYGDYSPLTSTGKLITAFFTIPFGLSIFGLLIGRIATYCTQQWRRGLTGLRTVKMKNHYLVIGWNGQRTIRLLQLLMREQIPPHSKPIVLCVKAEIENPLVGEVSFVKVNSFVDDQQMQRTSIHEASCIIIDNENDDLTLSTLLYCNSLNSEANMIAHFKDDKISNIAKAHCKNVECSPDVSVELLAKAAVDKGSSALHHQLLDVSQGMTQYALEYDTDQSTTVNDLFISLKNKYHATLIAIKNSIDEEALINPELNVIISKGAVIYYIADERIVDINWSRIIDCPIKLTNPL